MRLNKILAGTIAGLVGVFFFFAIVGVFGLKFAIAGLAVFVLGAVVVYVAFPAQSAES
jgi:uncharacterized membrane protein YeaQ/YmgE (transglycosylase-associated protein family)